MNAILNEELFAETGKLETNPSSVSAGAQPTVLADIYNDKINIAVWQRNFNQELADAISHFVASNPSLSKSLTVSPETAYEQLDNKLLGSAPKVLLENIVELVDMFCCLFDLKQTGLRIATLSNAMCPRFHIDNVPCRLVSTYQGTATEWLPNHVLDRSKLGHGNNGKPDSSSGLYTPESSIQQLTCGDVALLKGELWSGNENLGLVHRSPINASSETRLLITLDFD